MKLVEYIARAILDIRCCYDSNCFIRELRCELGPALGIFDRGDARSDYLACQLK